jgi:2',3'-cyclic-nucleotide 2'-phosphodiesterase/3'-nucleotidase
MSLVALLAALVLPPADTAHVVLVATTDLHGYAGDWNYVQNLPWPGGLARAATIIDSLRQRYPGQVVVVDAGDALAGNVFAGYYGTVGKRSPHPVIEAMSLAGYDVATPGEREFDFGIDRFNQAVSGATFRYVTGNVRLLPEDTLAFPSYVVLQRGGVRIAVSGLTTPGAMVWNGPRLRGKARIDRIETSAARVLPHMREDADLAVLLVHSGMSGASSYDTTGLGGEHVAARLAQGTERPDLVVVGHSSQEIIDSTINGVHFVQPRPDGISLSVVHISLTRENGRYVPREIRGQRVLLAETRPLERVLRRLDDAHGEVLRWSSVKVGENEQRISLAAARVEDIPLMRLMLKAVRQATGADLAALPAPDLRIALDPGEVTQGSVFRLYPWEHRLKTVRISGADLKAYLEQDARYFFVDAHAQVFPNLYVPGAWYDILSGATYVLDLGKPMGSRIVALAVKGRTVAPSDSFTLSIPDVRREGQGAYAMLIRAPLVKANEPTVQEALRAELGRAKVVRVADYEGRDWSLTPSYLARRARALFITPTGPDSAAAADTTPEPFEIPQAPTRADLLRQDSLDRLRERADSAAGAVVATLRLPAERAPGTGLLRLLADAYRNDTRSDVAVVIPEEGTNPLPARGLSAGEVRAAAMGDATLLTIGLSGAELRALVETALARRNGPCCEFSGLRVEYDPRRKPWDRVRKLVLSTGKELDPRQNYLLTFSSRLAVGDAFPLGATNCRPVKGCQTPGRLSQYVVERSERHPADALLEYLSKLRQPVTPPDDQRLVPTR